MPDDEGETTASAVGKSLDDASDDNNTAGKVPQPQFSRMSSINAQRDAEEGVFALNDEGWILKISASVLLRHFLGSVTFYLAPSGVHVAWLFII
eukprot:scaffold273063_cov31-Prasinocladus_malaysianus.AAC.1